MFDPGTAISLIGGVASLFGGNKASKAAAAARARQDSYLGGVSANAGRYGTMADDAFSHYNTYAPQQEGAYSAYHDYLTRNPDTDQQFTMDTERSMQRSRGAYDAARANARASAAARGLSDAGGIATGGAQGVDLAEAGDISQAGQSAAQIAAQRRAANLAADYSLTTGQAGDAYGRGNQALGTQTDLERELASIYGGQADAATQAANANAGDTAGLFGDLGSVLGNGSAYKDTLAKLLGKTPAPTGAPVPFAPGGTVNFNNPASWNIPPPTSMYAYPKAVTATNPFRAVGFGG